MTLRIVLELVNDVFQDDDYTEEVERILTNIASRLPVPLTTTNGSLTLLDANGNYTGKATITAR